MLLVGICLVLLTILQESTDQKLQSSKRVAKRVMTGPLRKISNQSLGSEASDWFPFQAVRSKCLVLHQAIALSKRSKTTMNAESTINSHDVMENVLIDHV